jgi:hypothetical protein
MMRAFLDVSTCHLSPDTRTWLDAQFADDRLRSPDDAVATIIAGGKTRYGWFVYAPEDAVDGLPDDLVRVLAEARGRGAEYVLFDADAATMDGMMIEDTADADDV